MAMNRVSEGVGLARLQGKGSSSGDSMSRRKKTILCVDDDHDQVQLVGVCLPDAGTNLEVKTTTRPQDGLEILNHSQIHCIVSDFDMPGMNGLEFLEAAREIQPAIPFILRTSYGRDSVPIDIDSLEGVVYQRKGGSIDQFDQLASSIEELLSPSG